jgi:hypothetical protein
LKSKSGYQVFRLFREHKEGVLWVSEDSSKHLLEVFLVDPEAKRITHRTNENRSRFTPVSNLVQLFGMPMRDEQLA